MSDLISRQDAIDVLDGGAELLRRVLDGTAVSNFAMAEISSAVALERR